ncbi:MAG: cytochrome C oxidase subunit IV family protein [Rhodocyclaceae bacterium]
MNTPTTPPRAASAAAGTPPSPPRAPGAAIDLRAPSPHGSAIRALTIWIILIAATGVTWMVGERGEAGPWIVALVLSLACIKGALIVLDYMALRNAPLLWRALLLGWLIAVCALIGLAYWKGLAP